MAWSYRDALIADASGDRDTRLLVAALVVMMHEFRDVIKEHEGGKDARIRSASLRFVSKRS